MDRKLGFIIHAVLISGLILSMMINVYLYTRLRWIRYTIVIGVKDDLELQMTIQNPIIIRGEQINITLTLRNIGKNNVTIEHSGYLFDVYLYGPFNKLVCRWSDGKVFAASMLSLTLQPKETRTQILQWNLYRYDPQSGEYIPPRLGNYHLVGVCVSTPRITTHKLPITITS